MRARYQGRKKILICAVSSEDLRSLVDALPEDRFFTEYFQDAESFFKSPVDVLPDLILHGITSEKPGPESISRFINNPVSCGIPVIAVVDTAFYNRKLIFDSGACDYILLPICDSEVIAKIDWHLSFQESRGKENLLISTINSMSDILFVIDENGIFIEYYQTDLSEELYIPPEIFLGRNYREIMPPHVVILTDNAMNELLNTGRPQQYEYYMDIGAMQRWFSAKLSIRKNHAGNFSGVVAVIRDVTDCKVTEDSLLKQKDFNEMLIQNCPAFFVAISSSGKIIMMNKSMLNALGYTFEEVVTWITW